MSKGGRVYTPQETVRAEKEYITAVGDNPPVFEGPVSLELTFMEDATLVTIKPVETWDTPLRGDLDNYCKLALDGIQRAGVLKDDRQVVILSAVKIRSGENE
jgi:Holliday junction resolvase RusA-like endonuclease